MALDPTVVIDKAVSKFEAKGFKRTDANLAFFEVMAESWVEHVNESGEVVIESGSSAGTYKIK